MSTMDRAAPVFEDVAIADIHIGDRRPVDPKKVAALKESIEEVGLLHPVGLTGDNDLIHGRHRLEACKALGWKKIPSMRYSLDSLHAELAEIDENLLRCRLTKLEEAEAHKRRKEIYEALHPQAKHGGARRGKARVSSGQVGHLKRSYADDAAEKTGKKARTVRRQVGLAERIPEELRQQLAGKPIENNQRELEQLARLPGADQRLVVERLSAGAKSVSEAIKAVATPWSEAMRKAVIAKTALDDLAEAPDYDIEARDAELKQLAQLPVDEQCTVAARIRSGEADSVAAAIEMQEGPESTGASGDVDITDPEPYAPNVEGKESRTEDLDSQDPVAIYRELLQDLPSKASFLERHFDEIVGQGLEPAIAAVALRQGIEFLESVYVVEESLAETTEEEAVAV